MSSTSSHLNPDTLADGQRTPRTPTSPGAAITRTVAIIKTHALEHRFDIEQRITEAGFEIVKERQMEFDIESDPDTMFDIFGSEYVSFGEGPVWVYVLERRKAVEVWQTLMGDADPEVARAETSNSLRAIYGKNKEQNAVMGSPDAESAEIQIQSIFASSPPFPSSELPDVGSPDPFASYTTGTDDSRQRTTSEKSRSSGSDKPKFRARALPATHVAPDIVPRMSRAASLRAGIVEDKPKRFPATPESLKKTFAGVPGHKRAETIQVASTAPPVVAPRMTRAAALRLGQPVPSTTSKIERRTSSGGASVAEVFDGIPGHKRRESIQVASTRPPTVTPRSNRSAELRVLKDAASPPSSFRSVRSPGSLSRSSSRSSLDVPGNQRPSFATTTRPASAASMRTVNGANGTPTKTKPPSRPPSTKPLSSSPAVNSKKSPDENTATATPPASKPRPTVASTGAPTISPRTNKSALLRAAKMALSGGATKTTTPVKTSTKSSVKVQAPKPIRA